MERKEDAIIRVYEVLKDNNVPSKAAHQVVSTILDNGFKIEDPNMSDQYHTMKELYHYRMLYNALAANALNEGSKIRATKSWRHHDGELCFGGGWFIVTIDLSTSTEQNKQVTNHYKSEHWDLFKIPELPVADQWNGHSPAEGAEDLRAFLSP